MMNPYKQILAFRLWFLGFRPMLVLQSHLSPLYLGINVHTHLEVTTSTWGLSMAISLEGTTCLSLLGCSALGSTTLDLATLKSSNDLNSCDLTGAFHVTIYFPGHPQVICRTTIAPPISWSLPAATRLCSSSPTDDLSVLKCSRQWKSEVHCIWQGGRLGLRHDASPSGLFFLKWLLQFSRITTHGEVVHFPVNDAFNARMPRFPITALHLGHWFQISWTPTVDFFVYSWPLIFRSFWSNGLTELAYAYK